VLFTETRLPGVFIVEPQRLEDERGFFARSWSPEEFEAHGLNPRLAQCSISYNKRKGTLRGMHYQVAPRAEAKLVRCTAGAIYDVALDLRPESPAFRQWISAELTPQNHKMLYIPEGLAHGFQTLTDDAEVFYQISESYHPESARGVRWDDPAFALEWPLPPTAISQRDSNHPRWETGS
jgi:dTDP-4-dehydrorhamnose 3,5-epimerase